MGAADMGNPSSGPTGRTRVLFITMGLTIGGNEFAVMDLGLNLDRDRFEPSFAHLRARGFTADRLESAGFRVHPQGFPTRGFWTPAVLGCVWRLRRLLQRERIDIVHAYGFAPSLLAAFAVLGTRVTLISARVQMTGWYGPRQRLGNWLVSRRARYVVYNARAIWQGAPWEAALPPAKARVIPNPIGSNAPSSAGEAADLRERHGIPVEHCVVGMVANLREIKNPMMLVRVAEQVVRERDDVTFVFVGEGPLRAELEEAVQQRGLERQVRILGWVSPSGPAYRTLDIFVLTSLSEGSPLSVMEAMSHGLPVVATAVGGVPELVRQGENGILVESGDAQAMATAVLELAGDRELRSRLGASSRRIFDAEYSLASVVQRTQQLYDEARPPGPRT